jgi:putative transposase
MSWISIWVHVVFCTKNREPFLRTLTLRKQIFEHIRQNASQKQIWLDSVNGYEEHVHCLISLGRDQCISDIMHLIKGESSFWINKNKLIHKHFMWQDDYWAVGVSQSKLNSTRLYLFNQENHHGSASFNHEINDFIEKNQFNSVSEKHQIK